MPPASRDSRIVRGFKGLQKSAAALATSAKESGTRSASTIHKGVASVKRHSRSNSRDYRGLSEFPAVNEAWATRSSPVQVDPEKARLIDDDDFDGFF